MQQSASKIMGKCMQNRCSIHRSKNETNSFLLCNNFFVLSFARILFAECAPNIECHWLFNLVNNSTVSQFHKHFACKIYEYTNSLCTVCKQTSFGITMRENIQSQ